MNVEITEKWLEEGELCLRGSINGKKFAVIHVDTDIDFGWHELKYLPSYSDEISEIDMDCEEWEAIEDLNRLELKASVLTGS